MSMFVIGGIIMWKISNAWRILMNSLRIYLGAVHV